MQTLLATFNFMVRIEEAVFASMPNLREVYIGARTVIQYYTILYYSLGGNELSQFPPVHVLPHLTVLSLNNNKLTAVGDLCMVWYGMVWYGMVWHGMAWYGMVWHGMVWYIIILLIVTARNPHLEVLNLRSNRIADVSAIAPCRNLVR